MPRWRWVHCRLCRLPLPLRRIGRREACDSCLRQAKRRARRLDKLL
jgi:hypothetical protein